MAAQEPDRSTGLATPASVDSLVEQLRARVEARREAGEYPPGLEQDLDAHFRQVAAARRGPSTLRGHLDALRDSSAFAAERITTASRLRAGRVYHRFVARAVARQTQGVLAQVSEFAAEVQRTLEAIVEPLEALGIGSAAPGVSKQLDALHAVVVEQQRALNAQRTDLLEVIDRRSRSSHPVEAAPESFRPWYESERFESAFRGSRRDLLARYRDLAERFVGCDPVLDIGFGRGELLELLGTLGVDARGVESDPLLVELAADQGLDALLDDGNTYLRTVADQSLGGLALIQVVEHLSAQQLLDLVALAARKVRPGGRMIMETVNPQSLYVYAHSFYLDPTHVRPVHPGYLEFLLREAGFAEVEIDWRNPPREWELLQPLPGEDPGTQQMNTNIENLNALLFAPQDYAIIATR
jgi:2-polyprenyl-3-methyl-5-hydroxy-6-metoxy-1,4-benzoquinol methylase